MSMRNTKKELINMMNEIKRCATCDTRDALDYWHKTYREERKRIRIKVVLVIAKLEENLEELKMKNTELEEENGELNEELHQLRIKYGTETGNDDWSGDESYNHDL